VDLEQLLLDHPMLSLLVVIPMVGFAAALKIGVVLMTGRGDPPPDAESDGEARSSGDSGRPAE
jgi:hypothetical protein